MNAWKDQASESRTQLSSLHPHHPVQMFGYHIPYGATIRGNGVHFSVFSRSAQSMKLLLYQSPEDIDPSDIILLNRDLNRWGDIWSIFIPQIKEGALYHFQADGPNDHQRGLRFNKNARLLDPYARAYSGEYLRDENGLLVPPKCVVINEHYDWRGDRHLRIPMSESIIYEMHIGGFTRSKTSRCDAPGTFLGVIEKIPYLNSLGVTAVELMPVHEFVTETPLAQPGPKTENYWGYSTVGFFAPHQGYTCDRSTPGQQVREFKDMVLALHQAGIEVILDVVFNHTAEGNELGPTLNFKGLENQVYYMLESDPRYYKNYSGCGNTVNGNHPIVREMIFSSLRHWVHNYHVDGFRFDLASILSRDRNGHLVPNPPVLETIAEDPLLADTKIIAEAWDAAGAYQVGSFGSHRWAEWNGRYRDDIRRYWRGDPYLTSALATRLGGSSDLYKHMGRNPAHSVNFVTAHDGFTLNDLVSYNVKHNVANGEQDRDGENNNYSMNFGVEGPTDDHEIKRMRLQQIKNYVATLMFSQGVPMFMMGDELCRTQAGNNNAYCQNNEISWMNWDAVYENKDILRFFQLLIEFRRSEPTLKHNRFLTGRPSYAGGFPDVAWFSASGHPFNWASDEKTLIMFLSSMQNDQEKECLLDTGNNTDLKIMSGSAQSKNVGVGMSEDPELQAALNSEIMYPVEDQLSPPCLMNEKTFINQPMNALGEERRSSSHLLLIFHAADYETQVTLPSMVADLPWRLHVDTASESPRDIYRNLDGPLLDNNIPFKMAPRSLRCYITPGGDFSIF